MSLYAQDGVNVVEGDSFSAAAAQVCRASVMNNRYISVHDFSRGHFRGPRGFELHGRAKGLVMDVAPDGVGTKTSVIDAASAHRRASQNLAAMCNGDITRWGGLPVLLTNVLDVSTLGREGDPTNQAFREMILGLGDVAREQAFVVYKGETAELGVCVGSDNPDALTKFNWVGVAFGVYDPERMITGDTLAAGQMAIVLRELGLRSNGISSARKALSMKFGPQWFKNPEAAEAIKAAAEPAVLYDRFLTHMNGWYTPAPLVKAHLIVHITGGAFKSKLGEDILFPRGLSAQLDDLWDPPEIMRQCAEWRGMKDEEIHETWNGGQGALAVVDEKDADAFVNCAAEYGIEAKVAGPIFESKTPSVRIKSKFNGRTIVYN